MYNNLGITICPVTDEKSGIAVVLSLLHALLDKQTVLYLSGGRTPKTLYGEIARGEKLHPGAVAMVDERYGDPMHENSNERMLSESALLRFATILNIPFHQILRPGLSREERSDEYDQKVRTLLSQYKQHVAILGIGMDGHTAGIPSKASLGVKGQDAETFVLDLAGKSKDRMVIDYDDKSGFYKERITMTFQGLSMMDILIVLVFGKDKKPALELLFSDGPEADIPSRFFKRTDIASKTLVITDQEV